jgi:sodium-dependent dicarboxylate transporter 2/3/5
MSARFWSILGGLLLGATVFGVTSYLGLTAAQSWTAAVTTLCATWWILEPIPSAATALVPLVVFQLAGVLKERDVAAAYGDPVVLLFLGAFMISRAVEHWGAHRRIAHALVAHIGKASAPRVLLAVMLTTTLGSFWINNTSITLMMLPVALAIIEQDKSGKMAVPFLLGVAYSSSIGGVATPIGTMPNGIFQTNYFELTGRTIPFHEWIVVAGTVSMLVMSAAWVVFSWGLRGVPAVQIEAANKWTPAQKRSLLVFGAAAIAWMTREVPFGGWSAWLPQAFDGNEGDMCVAIAGALAMFLIPSGDKKAPRLLDWQIAEGIPWGVLILFGGGIAIATAFKSSGLSEIVGTAVTGIQNWPPLAIIAMLCLMVTFLSEFTSNTATSNILMPILGAAANANGMDPALLMFPATLANSLAFMMPVGTPPNAIVYGTGGVRIIDMVRYGFVLNLIGVVIVTLVCWQLMPIVFGVEVVRR